jgi:hypothetical protein
MAENYVTVQDILDAFTKSGIEPIQGTWNRSRGPEGARRPCGCALVALAVARGVDTLMLENTADSYSVALRIPAWHASGILNGWDDFSHVTLPDPMLVRVATADQSDDYLRGWRVAFAAAKETFSGRTQL